MTTESSSRRMAHPVVARAAEGVLPSWTEAGPKRRDHMGRVAALMGAWAQRRCPEEYECQRWRAAGWLHDALRDARLRDLRAALGDHDQELPGVLLHGPAVALRLRDEGLVDQELLTAIEFHSRDHESFGDLGNALYTADFLEPGRPDPQGIRAEIRSTALDSLDTAMAEVREIRQGLHPGTRGNRGR